MKEPHMTKVLKKGISLVLAVVMLFSLTIAFASAQDGFDPGRQSLMMGNRGTGTGQIWGNYAGNDVSFPAVDTYTLSLWVNGRATNFRLNAFTNTRGIPTDFFPSNRNINTNGQWQQLTTTFTTTSGTGSSNIHLTGSAGAGNTLLIDGFSLTRAGNPGVNLVQNPGFEDGSVRWWFDWTGGDWATNPDSGFSIFVHPEDTNPPIINVTGVTLSANALTLSAGETAALTATVTPPDATNLSVIWTSDNADVASVNNGVVTAVKEGLANITVTTEDGGFTAVAAITVEDEDTTAPTVPPGPGLDQFSGRFGQWNRVEHNSVSDDNLTLRTVSDTETLYTIVEGANRDTRNVFYISIAGRDGGFMRLDRPNVHFIVANGYLYRPTAAQESNTTPEWFGSGASANAVRLGRIGMEYWTNWTGMRLRLDQIGNPNPADIRISWQGFSTANMSTAPANLPANTGTYLRASAYIPERCEDTLYLQEDYSVILNPLVGGGVSIEGNVASGQTMGYAYVSWRSLEPVRGQLDLDAARVYVWGDYPIMGPDRDQWGSRAPLLTTRLNQFRNAGAYVQLRMIMDLPEGHRSGVAAPPAGGPAGVSNADQVRYINLMNRTVADIPDWAVAAMRHESNRPNPACPDNIPNRPDFDTGDGLYQRMRNPNDPNAKFFEAYRDQPFVHFDNPTTVPDGYFRCAIPNPNGGPDLRICPNGCEPYRRPTGLRASGNVSGTVGALQQTLGWNPDNNWGPEGTWYFALPSISGGVGLSPRYDHHMLLHYHENIMKTLAEEIARPDSPWNAVAQVQLGSLGFWGEWHNWPAENSATFPNAQIAYPFVEHYMDAFADNPNVQVGMRYANWISSKYDLGHFHDEAGQFSHFRWINTIAGQNLSPDNNAPDGWGRGHNTGQTDIAYNLNSNMTNIPSFTGFANNTQFNDAARNPTSWMSSWSGGEYGDTSAPGRENNQWLSQPAMGDSPTGAMRDVPTGTSGAAFNSVMRTIYAFRWGNVSNLAPRGPAAGRTNATTASAQQAHKNNDAAYDNMGYRFVVEESSAVVENRSIDVQMIVNNKGVAPFYRDWPFEVSFIDAQGNVAATQIIDSVNVSDWMPRHRAFNNARTPMTNYRLTESGAKVYYRTADELRTQGTLFIPAFDGRNEVEFKVNVPDALESGEYTLAIAILDPVLRNGNPGIRFHNVGTRADWRLPLNTVEVDGSVSSVDTTALEEAISRFTALYSGDFTAQSWAVAEQAYTLATAVLAKADAAQEQIDEAASMLNSAIDGLEAREIKPPTVMTGTSSAQLNAALAEGDVNLTTPGSGGFGVSANSPLTVPAGSTLYVHTILNVRRDATLLIEGTVVVLEEGRINNDGGGIGGGTIIIAEGGQLINYGRIENATNSSIFNNGTITNNGKATGDPGRFEIREGTIFINNGIVDGNRALNIHRNAILEIKTP